MFGNLEEVYRYISTSGKDEFVVVLSRFCIVFLPSKAMQISRHESSSDVKFDNLLAQVEV
ncbi:hypothetical protein RR46_04225 [Papilio xuthus]|uniref:Uncharacterized protein n=1 Tax=Papilio xuthus TaxID=66420 RepID=A0A194QDI9_PAPXU|nr:hypothetical protein RR46_04225 [Papilio xuthus]